MWRKAADIAFWIGTSLYFGGLVTLGAIVAPAVFHVSTAAHLSMPGIAAPPLSMEPQVGGEIFGEVLSRFAWLQIASLVLILVAMVAWFFGHKKVRRSTWVLVVLWVLVTGFTAYDVGYLRPRVFVVRDSIRRLALHGDTVVATSSVAAPSSADWPEQREFDALHVRSEMLGHWESYGLMAMIVVAAWRGLAEKRSNRDH